MSSVNHNQPNILFIMADDHRYDAMSCMGDATVKTPVMDALSQRGAHLRGMHIMGGYSGAVCIPTRACMNTGRNPFSTNRAPCGFMNPAIISAENTLMGEQFGQAGYDTFHTGKWHLSTESLNRSFQAGRNMFLGGMDDHWRTVVCDYDPTGAYPEAVRRVGEQHSSELFADTAVQFIAEREADASPFFLSCCFTSPHDPRTAPERFHAQYPPEEIPLPPNFMPRHPFDNGQLLGRDEELAPHPRTPERIQREMSDYYAIITHQDEQMGRILAALDAGGLTENTIVVYTGDHGLSIGQHGLLGKQDVYDHSIRPPWLMTGPGIPAGRGVDALVYSFDVFPTLCEAAGVAIPESVQGDSRWELIQGKTEAGNDCAYAIYCDLQASLKRGDWKLIRYYETELDRPAHRGLGTNRVQLFNLVADPDECDDLSQDVEYAAILQDMGKRLQAQQVALGDPLATRDVARA